MNKKHPTTIRANKHLEPLLDKYTKRFGGQSKAITNVFLCYDTMMKIERRELRKLFNQPEIDLMLNNAMSAAYIPQLIPGAVLASTEDEEESVFKYYGVDRAVILDKLRNLTLSQQFSLVDWLIELRGNEVKAPEDDD
jgi:hypothetical protein